MSRIQDYQINGTITSAEYVRNLNSKNNNNPEYEPVKSYTDEILGKNVGLRLKYKLSNGEEKEKVYFGNDLTKILNDAQIKESEIEKILSKPIVEYDFGEKYKGIYFK
ncbi:MAG TPA: hypothetical protein V6C58_08405 [Allocoleopsis sp.]